MSSFSTTYLWQDFEKPIFNEIFKFFIEKDLIHLIILDLSLEKNVSTNSWNLKIF